VEKIAIFDQHLSLGSIIRGVSSVVNNRRAVYSTKRRRMFIAADGDAKTPRISESSRELCNVAYKLLWSMYVDNTKRRRRYQSTAIRQREQKRT